MHLYHKLVTILPLATLLISAAFGAIGNLNYLYPAIVILELIIFFIFIWLWTDPIRNGFGGAIIMIGGNFAAARLAEIYATREALPNNDMLYILMVFIALKIWAIYAINKQLAEMLKSFPKSKL